MHIPHKNQSMNRDNVNARHKFEVNEGVGRIEELVHN